MQLFTKNIFCFYSSQDNRNLFPKLKKLGLYHVELRSQPIDSLEKITLTLLETQQLPDIEKIDSKNEISSSKWTIYNGRRKVYINLQTDTDKVNIVVYCYRNNTYPKDTEMDLKLTEDKNLLSAFASWAILTFSTSGELYWMKQLFKKKLCQDWMFFSN